MTKKIMTKVIVGILSFVITKPNTKEIPNLKINKETDMLMKSKK